jgi:hypothetical protein
MEIAARPAVPVVSKQSHAADANFNDSRTEITNWREKTIVPVGDLP